MAAVDLLGICFKTLADSLAHVFLYVRSYVHSALAIFLQTK